MSTPASAGDAAEPTQPVADRAHGSRRRLLAIADTNFIWVLLLLVMAVASLTSTSFLSASNLSNVLLASASLGCLVIAQGLVLLTGNFDLSTESSMILSAIVGTIVMESATGGAVLGTEAGGLGWPWWAGLIVMLVVPMFVGLLNGVMIVRLRMNPFMVTLAVSIILPGIALILGEGQTLVNVPPDFRFLGRASIGPVPAAGIVLLVLFLVVHVLLSRTVFGRQLYAVGSNRHAARAAGISDQRVIASAYILCGLFVGFAAFLLVGRLGAASAGISSGALFLSVAAAVIGGVSLTGGRGTAAGMLGGLLVISVINNAMNLANIAGNLIAIVAGSAILLAVFVDAIRSRRASAAG